MFLAFNATCKWLKYKHVAFNSFRLRFRRKAILLEKVWFPSNIWLGILVSGWVMIIQVIMFVYWLLNIYICGVTPRIRRSFGFSLILTFHELSTISRFILFLFSVKNLPMIWKNWHDFKVILSLFQLFMWWKYSNLLIIQSFAYGPLLGVS